MTPNVGIGSPGKVAICIAMDVGCDTFRRARPSVTGSQGGVPICQTGADSRGGRGSANSRRRPYHSAGIVETRSRILPSRIRGHVPRSPVQVCFAPISSRMQSVLLVVVFLQTQGWSMEPWAADLENATLDCNFRPRDILLRRYDWYKRVVVAYPRVTLRYTHTQLVRSLRTAGTTERCYMKECVGCEDCGELLAAAQARRSRNSTHVLRHGRNCSVSVLRSILLMHRHVLGHAGLRQRQVRRPEG
jgi:hypothetical protein